jgi:hypothetical protein
MACTLRLIARRRKKVRQISKFRQKCREKFPIWQNLAFFVPELALISHGLPIRMEESFSRRRYVRASDANLPPTRIMNIAPEIQETLPQDPSEAALGSEWNSETIVRLIRRNSARGYMPSMLMLGKRESAMLRDHLAQAFGQEEVSRLNELHYAGLKVVETQIDSLVKVAGERMLPEFERASRHVPVWKDESDTSRWRFDAGLA